MSSRALRLVRAPSAADAGAVRGGGGGGGGGGGDSRGQAICSRVITALGFS